MDEKINNLFLYEKFDEIALISNELILTGLKPKTINQIGVARFKTKDHNAGIEAFKIAAQLDDQYASNYLRALEKARCIGLLCATTVSKLSFQSKIKVCYWTIERYKDFEEGKLKNLIETSLSEERFYVLQQLLLDKKLELASVLAGYMNLSSQKNISRVLSIFRAIGRQNFLEKIRLLPGAFNSIAPQLKLVDLALDEKYHEFVDLFNSDSKIFMRCSVLQDYYLKSLATLDKKGLFLDVLSSDKINLSVKAAYQKFVGQKKRSIETLRLVLENEADETARWAIIYNLAEQGYYHDSVKKKTVEKLPMDVSRVILLNAKARYLYDLKKYEESFDSIKASNDLHRSLSIEPSSYEHLISFYKNARSLNRVAPCLNEYGPVFIVGSPRCGSTLLAAKLCSNSTFVSLGESNLVGLGLQKINTGRTYQEVADYITERLKKNANGNTPVIKLLDNIFYVPQILHLFPRAKIIYLSRDRKDTAWSIFENFFTSRWMVYANSIEKIERHLNAVEEASNLWQKMAYQNYLTINYNDLATQTTETLNMLSEFLGSAVKNKKVVGQVTYTGSASQVHSEVKFQTGKWANLHEFFDKNFKTTWDRL